MKLLSQCCAALSLFFLLSCHNPAKVGEQLLSDNWTIVSSKKIALDGAALTTSNDFDQSQWVKTKVPATVMGALVDAGVIKDPFFRN